MPRISKKLRRIRRKTIRKVRRVSRRQQGGVDRILLEELDAKLGSPSVNDITLRGPLSDAQITKLIAALKASPNLEYLQLERNRLGDDKLERIIPHIPIGIRSLTVDYNEITDRGAQALAAQLRKFTLLRLLSLSGNTIANAGSEAICDAIAPTKRFNNTQESPLPNFQALYLSNNRIGLEGAYTIADATKRMPEISTVSLTGNDIEKSDLQSIYMHTFGRPNGRRIRRGDEKWEEGDVQIHLIAN